MRTVVQLALLALTVTCVGVESSAPKLCESIQYRIVSSDTGDDGFVSQLLAQAGSKIGLSDCTERVSDRGAIRSYAGRELTISIDARRRGGEIVVVARRFSLANDKIAEKRTNVSYRELKDLVASALTNKFRAKLTIANIVE